MPYIENGGESNINARDALRLGNSSISEERNVREEDLPCANKSTSKAQNGDELKVALR